MPKIDSLKKGEVSVDGNKYTFNVWLFADGRVMERQAIDGTKIAVDEIQTMMDNVDGLQEIVIASENELPVDKEAIEKATGANVLLVQCNLGEAMEFFNKEVDSKKIGAIMVIK
jgi:hypothetical protein